MNEETRLILLTSDLKEQVERLTKKNDEFKKVLQECQRIIKRLRKDLNDTHQIMHDDIVPMNINYVDNAQSCEEINKSKEGISLLKETLNMMVYLYFRDKRFNEYKGE